MLTFLIFKTPVFAYLICGPCTPLSTDCRECTHGIALLDVEHGALEVRRLAQLRRDVGDEAVVEDGVVLVLLLLGGRGHRRRSTASLPLGEGLELGLGEQVGLVSRLS